MADIQSILERRGVRAEDLRQCVNAKTLVSLVFEALHAVEQEQAQVMGSSRLPVGRPRVLVSLLTLSYAVGIDSSDEIERQIAVDPELRYLSANAAPTAAELRHCRRQHRDLLQRTLTRLLRLVWEAQQCLHTLDGIQSSPELERLFEAAARDRLNQAILADTMALDQ